MNDDRHVSPNEHWRWSCDRVRGELDAWSLGALEPAEKTAVDRHIADCDACRDEAEALARVASMLPLALQPIRPSDDVKRKLMSRIADDQMSTNMPNERVRVPLKTGDPTGHSQARKSFHWSQMLVAPLAIALLVMSLWAFELKGQVNEQEDASSTRQTASMLPEGFQAFSMQSECETCNSTGKLLADPAKADALMVAWNLDPSEVHEVWCEESDGERVLVASFEVSENGDIVQPLVFDQPIAGYSKIYVTNADGETVEIRMDPPEDAPASPGISTT